MIGIGQMSRLNARCLPKHSRICKLYSYKDIDEECKYKQDLNKYYSSSKKTTKLYFFLFFWVNISSILNVHVCPTLLCQPLAFKVLC